MAPGARDAPRQRCFGQNRSTMPGWVQIISEFRLRRIAYNSFIFCCWPISWRSDGERIGEVAMQAGSLHG